MKSNLRTDLLNFVEIAVIHQSFPHHNFAMYSMLYGILYGKFDEGKV